MQKPERFTIYLMPREVDALIELAETQKRDLRAQVAIILRQELVMRGLLPFDNQKEGINALKGGCGG
ncbi:MAG: hypothetical protein P4L50_25475 [Anaerolineaceae bacterium]|nr:hypothetical protein [Anaerolineaceae bacterium]